MPKNVSKVEAAAVYDIKYSETDSWLYFKNKNNINEVQETKQPPLEEKNNLNTTKWGTS